MRARRAAIQSLLALFLAGLVGCRSNPVSPGLPSANDADPPRDAAPDKNPAKADAAGGPDALPPAIDLGQAFPVTGTQVRLYFDEQGESKVVPNLGDVKVAAWWLSPAGEYKFFPGKGGPDGRISVPDVPAGPFLLRFGNVYLASSTVRTFDLSSWGPGRPDKPWAGMKPTTLSLTLGGLAPWQMGDRVIFYAPAVLAGDNLLHVKILPAVALGATSLSGSADYTIFAAPAVLNGPGRGDEAWFLQQGAATTAQGERVLVTKKVLRTKALAIVDGHPATFTGTMLDVPATQSLAIDWPVPEYRALTATVSPVAGRMNGDFFVFAAPNADRFGDYGWSGHVVSAAVGADSPALKLTVSYGDPYPTTWGRVAGAYMRFIVPVLVPGAGTPGEVTAYMHVNDSLARFNAGPVRPIVTPPREPKINGRSAFAEMTEATPTPLVSWSPPAVGPPEVYKVFVYHARVSGGRVNMDRIATLWTHETSIRIPPELLLSGESYVLVIEALIEDGVSVGKPFNRALHRGFAQTVTARFTP